MGNKSSLLQINQFRELNGEKSSTPVIKPNKSGLTNQKELQNQMSSLFEFSRHQDEEDSQQHQNHQIKPKKAKSELSDSTTRSQKLAEAYGTLSTQMDTQRQYSVTKVCELPSSLKFSGQRIENPKNSALKDSTTHLEESTPQTLSFLSSVQEGQQIRRPSVPGALLVSSVHLGLKLDQSVDLKRLMGSAVSTLVSDQSASNLTAISRPRMYFCPEVSRKFDSIPSLYYPRRKRVRRRFQPVEGFPELQKHEFEFSVIVNELKVNQELTKLARCYLGMCMELQGALRAIKEAGDRPGVWRGFRLRARYSAGELRAEAAKERLRTLFDLNII